MQDASIPSGIKDHLLRRNEGVANNAKYPAKFHTLASLGRHAGGASFADAKDLFTSQERGYDQRCVWPNFILVRHVTGVQDVSTPAGLKDHLFCRSEGAVIIVWSDGAGLPRGGVCRSVAFVRRARIPARL